MRKLRPIFLVLIAIFIAVSGLSGGVASASPVPQLTSGAKPAATAAGPQKTAHSKHGKKASKTPNVLQDLVANPDFAEFPKQIAGSSSAPQTIVVTNSSTTDTVQISSVGFDADIPGFTETDDCVGGLAPGGTCSISVSFAPQQGMVCTIAPDLIVNDDDPGGSLSIPLLGEAAAAGGLVTDDLTDPKLTPASLAQSLVGTGVTISNVKYTGVPLAAGTFSNGSGIIGFDKGIILSNGAVFNVLGPNCDTGITQDNQQPGDQDLTNLICTDETSCANPSTTNDAATLEFDFVPTNSLLTFQYVFASDEYPEFVFDFNDVFAFFLSQNGTPLKDIALIPGTNTIVSINNVNSGNPSDPDFAGVPPVNPQFYVDNNFQQPATAPLNTEMDGLTTVLAVQSPVVPGQTYHIKLAIADALDFVLDSNVFIKGGSLSSTNLSIAPPAVGFGTQNINSTSKAQSVTISNVGSTPISGVTIAATGPFAQTNNCPATLAAAPATGSSCVINVTFKPTVGGPANGAITITDSAPDSPQSITLGGSGVAGAFVTTNPFSLTFPPETAGVVSPPQAITVTNTGAAALTITTIGSSNDSFAETDNCVDVTIQANGTCTINVTYQAAQTGIVETGVLFLFDNAQNNGQQQIGLTGNATSTITIMPGTVAFGNQAINTVSAPQTVTFTNTGTSLVTIPSVVVGAGFAETNNCTAAQIPPQGICTVSVTFTPTTATTFATSLTFSDTAPNSPQIVALTGTGTSAAAGKVSIAPNSLTFTSQAVGTTSPSQNVVVTNTGNSTVTFTAIATTGDFAGATLAGCPSLAVEAQCTLAITFTPTAAGTRTGAITFTDNATGSPQTVGLTGTATAGTGTITIAPTSLTFTSQAVGTVSPSQNVVVTNTGTSTVTFTAIATTGDFAGATLNACPSLAAAAKCTFAITFTPTAAGTRTGAITFTDNATGSPQTVGLTGTATAGTGTITIAPTSLTFAQQALNTTSAPQSVTVKNTGTIAVNFTNIAASGDFAVAEGTTCSTDGGIAAGASCTVAVTFTPTANGTRTGTLAIANSATGSPQSVALTGSGGNSSVIITVPSGGSTTATTVPGGTAFYGLIVTGAPGATGVVTLTCASSSPLITCTVIPSTVTLNGGTTEVAFGIQTFCQGTTTGAAIVPTGFGGGIAMLLMTLMIGGIVGMFNKDRRVAVGFAMMLMFLALGLGSCASLPKGANGPTPAGTYFISLSSTFNGQTQTLPNFLTLVVK